MPVSGFRIINQFREILLNFILITFACGLRNLQCCRSYNDSCHLAIPQGAARITTSPLFKQTSLLDVVVSPYWWLHLADWTTLHSICCLIRIWLSRILSWVNRGGRYDITCVESIMRRCCIGVGLSFRSIRDHEILVWSSRSDFQM